MKRNKYINTFDTTNEFENYIESAAPGFPNVALTKDTGDVHYTHTSPNDHLIYGEVVDVNGTAPKFKFNSSNAQIVTSHIDAISGTFYIDVSDMTSVSSITTISNMCYGETNIKSIKKFLINTSGITNINNAFNYCSNLTKLNLFTWDLSNVTQQTSTFSSMTNLTDVYINVEATLNKLTSNLRSSTSSYGYIPSTATIHYDNGTQIIDYKWQNNAWTAQS